MEARTTWKTLGKLMMQKPKWKNGQPGKNLKNKNADVGSVEQK